MNTKRISVKFAENNNSFKVGFGQVHTLRGEDGKSAYDIAVENGFEGTEAEWLASLHGKDGATFTPSVSEDGVISWTNDKGLPNPAPVNLVKAVLAALGGDETHGDTTSELGKAILNKMILA